MDWLKENKWLLVPLVVGMIIGTFIPSSSHQTECRPEVVVERIIEKVQVPIAQDEVLDELYNCRKQMRELNEACNSGTNCRDQNCE